MRTIKQTLFAALALLALAAPACAQFYPGNVTPQLHQNGGGSNFGHVLMYADQPTDAQADHFSIFSNDGSELWQVAIAGSPAAGNTLTATFTLATVAHAVVYTVQAGDTTSTVATAFAACLNGGAVHCSGGAAFLAAMAAFLGSDGVGYHPSASAVGPLIFLDFPFAVSGNSVATSATGGGATITAAKIALDNGPYSGCARNVPGRTPTLGDQYCSLQFGFASGPNTGIDSLMLISSEYLGGSVGTPLMRWIIGANNGAPNATVALNIGPCGVALSDTDGSGNTAAWFAGNSYGEPGCGNLAVPGRVFLGVHGQTGLPVATAAGVETLGVLRILGNALVPSTGAGLELGYNGGTAQLLSFSRDASTYQATQLIQSSLCILPSNIAADEVCVDTAGVWPNQDNQISLGKSAKRWASIYGNNGVLNALALVGSGSGSTNVVAPATGGGTATFFPGNDTIAGKSVANGGTNCASASGTCLDNIAGFSSTGFLQRTGAGAYSFIGAGTGLGISGGNLNLQPAAAAVIGGVESYVAVAHQWINAVSTAGVHSSTQPACSDLSGVAASCSTDATNGSNISSGTVAAARLAAINLAAGNVNGGVTGTTPTANGGTGVTGGTALLVSQPVTVDFSVPGDNAIAIQLPSGFTRLGFCTLQLSNASADISAANYGVFTTTGGGGAAIIAAASPITVTATADSTNNNFQSTNCANIGTEHYTPVGGAIQFRVGSTAASGRTAKVTLRYSPLP